VAGADVSEAGRPTAASQRGVTRLLAVDPIRFLSEDLFELRLV
jgi:hypothetical protein